VYKRRISMTISQSVVTLQNKLSNVNKFNVSVFATAHECGFNCNPYQSTEFFKQMFDMPAVVFNDALKTTAPLSNAIVHKSLRNAVN